MVSDHREHIKKIREDFQASQRVKDSLNNSIQALAKDLYSKDTHFIFELIQNAEDNTYKEPEPSLSFHLIKTDSTGTQGADGALIIQNNEIGFSRENVDAICAVGRTTKSKAHGYIGEKGIGFKSVFRVTSTPYIFSNGYHFCLPERDEETGLGFIVPRWVEQVPEGVDLTQTTIILPLNKPDIGYEKIKKMLKEIEPETILFLSKLKEIIVKTGSGNNLIILKDNSKAPLVQILVDEFSQDKTVSPVNEFLFLTNCFMKPADILSEKRKGIEEREVSIAFPLNLDNESTGKIFAYLPVRSDTGLPFLINADFLVTSSREDIQEDESWNRWLRDCVSEIFVNAFDQWLETIAYRTLIFGFIPLETHSDFLKPVVKRVQDKLKDLEIIPTEPDGRRVKPRLARSASKSFRSLLSVNFYPEALLDTRIVLAEIETFQEQLKVLGVKQLGFDFVKSCFQDREWISQHDQDWLLKCYRYLATENPSSIPLLDCPIVPIEAGGKTLWSCKSEQSIYFECDEKCERVLEGVPDCANVKLAFLDKDFYAKLTDDKEILDWMTKTLRVKKFSARHYAADVLQWFEAYYQQITVDDIIATTIFLSEFADSDIDFKNIPILLADGRKMLFSQAKDLPGIQSVVTPECLDPRTGWQNIYVTEEDRKHLAVLSDQYVQNDPKKSDSIFKLIKSDACPKFRRSEIKPDDSFDGCISPELTEHEIELVKKARVQSAQHRRHEIVYYRFSSPTSLNKPINESLSQSLVNWLKSNLPSSNDERELFKVGLKIKVEYQYHGPARVYDSSDILRFLIESPWLPTTKGFLRPNQVFLPHQYIKEALGDSAAYFEGDLPNHILELLGIKSEATAEELISVLEQHSKNGDGSKEFAERVYRTLASRDLPANILKRLREGNLIFVAIDSPWAARKDVIWKNRKDVLGDDGIFLEQIYPKLKDFFVKTIWVEEDATKESFARRWLKLQKESSRDNQEIESNLTGIYREIRPICEKDEGHRPDWWQEFIDEAKIWTQGKVFESRDSVYVSDDGELEQIFNGNGIFFAWRPEKDSLSHWEVLYRTIGIRYLSESAKVSLIEDYKHEVSDHREYLTDSAKILIATWIKEQNSVEFQRLVKNQVFDVFLNTAESRVSSLSVTYRVDKIEKVEPSDCFWDKEQKVLLIKEESGGPTKNAIARTLARALMPNRAFKELADWIELVLGEKEHEWRIKQKSWRIPDEIRNWMPNLSQDPPSNETEANDTDSISTVAKEDSSKGIESTESESDQIIHPSTPDSSSEPAEKQASDSKPPERVSITQPPEKKPAEKQFDYHSELDNAFNRPGETRIKGEPESDDRLETNPERRRGKEMQEQSMRIATEPNPIERRRKTERTILEGPDEQVRKTLGEWYGGKCQICGGTFPERNGRPFFVANYLVQRKLARQVDTYANALCLCAEHFAKWQHGVVEADHIIDQIRTLQLVSEGGNRNLQLGVKLCGEECFIKFNEKHVIAFQELLNAYGPDDLSDLQGGDAV